MVNIKLSRNKMFEIQTINTQVFFSWVSELSHHTEMFYQDYNKDDFIALLPKGDYIQFQIMFGVELTVDVTVDSRNIIETVTLTVE